MRMRGSATIHKRALTLDDLHLIVNYYDHDSPRHDDLLFIAMLLTGFFGLLRLGEMTFPNDLSLQNWRKVTRRNTVHIQDDLYEFTLPRLTAFLKKAASLSLLIASTSTLFVTSPDISPHETPFTQ
jgi:hypothetical protein